MSEPSTATETTVAEKRAALRNAGVTVGSRGKLSAAQEQAYADLKASGRA